MTRTNMTTCVLFSPPKPCTPKSHMSFTTGPGAPEWQWKGSAEKTCSAEGWKTWLGRGGPSLAAWARLLFECTVESTKEEAEHIKHIAASWWTQAGMLCQKFKQMIADGFCGEISEQLDRSQHLYKIYTSGSSRACAVGSCSKWLKILFVTCLSWRWTETHNWRATYILHLLHLSLDRRKWRRKLSLCCWSN